MSYDISLQYFFRGESRVATEAETVAVAALLESVEITADPEFGSCGLTLADGSQLECYIDHFSGNGEPFDGGMIALRAGFTPAGAEFLAALLEASGCVAFAGGGVEHDSLRRTRSAGASPGGSAERQRLEMG